MDDEGLREEALHEPARLEEALAMGRGRGRRDVPALEDVEHQEIRRVVEDRRTRTDEEDEARQLLDVPCPRLLDSLLVDGVGRYGGLTEVVEQVVGEDLDGSHREERHEHARPEHAEHVAEVARCTHAHVLDDVREDLAPLQHALVEHEQ